MRVLLISANREQLPAPVVPLGILSVAGALRPNHEVRLADLCFAEDPIATAAAAARDFRPDVVGVGFRNLHSNAYDAGAVAPLLDGYASLASALRRSTTAPLVLGGSAFSLQPERMLALFGADHGVIGEGERAFPALVDELARGGRPQRLARGETSTALDELPAPARDLIDPRYFDADGIDNLQTKRGCAFACAYCDYPDLEGRLVRTRDPEAIAREVVERARVPSIKALFFVDSVFNVPRGHALAVCRAIERHGAPLPWVCYATPAVLDEELVAAMARAGCAGVEIGADGGTDESLARLRKPFRVEAIDRAHRLLSAHGVRDCHTFVLGAFGETADDVARSLEFVDRTDPDVAVFIVFQEDREQRDAGQVRARHRDEILRLLRREAPRRSGWVVPELKIRFGSRVQSLLRRVGIRGPSWLHLARLRRGATGGTAPTPRS